MSSKIFISYSRDNLDFMNRLVQDLISLQVNLWIDFKDILAGQDWRKAIEDGLEECDVMILGISPDAMNSPHVTAEWYRFHERRKPIIPILLEPTSNIPFLLGPLNRIDFTNETAYEERLDDLSSALGAVMEHQVDDYLIPLHKALPSSGSMGSIRSKPHYLQPKSQFVSAADMLDKVQRELWISGIAVNKVMRCEDSIRALLDRGGKLRILFVNPVNDPALAETARFVGSDPDELRQRLAETQAHALQWLSYAPAFQARRLQQRPSVGYFIADPDSERGVMTISPYFYKIDQRKGDDALCEPPFLYLDNRWDGSWFDNFKQDFEAMWDFAEPWPGA